MKQRAPQVPEPRSRLFFALWPDQELRRLLAAQRPAEGRIVPAENLHLTLVFLGGVTADVQAGLEAAAGGIGASGFELVLDRLGCWRRAGIAWLGASTVPGPLLTLQEALAEAAAGLGLPRETRAYQPHITLARRAPGGPEAAVEPIVWVANEFCLVRSRTRPEGAAYEVIRRWSLGCRCRTDQGDVE